jgi:hypothetical protein
MIVFDIQMKTLVFNVHKVLLKTQEHVQLQLLLLIVYYMVQVLNVEDVLLLKCRMLYLQQLHVQLVQ